MTLWLKQTAAHYASTLWSFSAINLRSAVRRPPVGTLWVSALPLIVCTLCVSLGREWRRGLRVQVNHIGLIDRNLEATLVSDDSVLLTGKGPPEYSNGSQLTNCIHKVAMITHNTLAAIANLLAFLAVILAVAYHVVAVNVRQAEQKRQE